MWSEGFFDYANEQASVSSAALLDFHCYFRMHFYEKTRAEPFTEDLLVLKRISIFISLRVEKDEIRKIG